MKLKEVLAVSAVCAAGLFAVLGFGALFAMFLSWKFTPVLGWFAFRSLIGFVVFGVIAFRLNMGEQE